MLEVVKVVVIALILFKAQKGIHDLNSGGCLYYYSQNVPGFNSSKPHQFLNSTEYKKYQKEQYQPQTPTGFKNYRKQSQNRLKNWSVTKY